MNSCIVFILSGKLINLQQVIESLQPSIMLARIEKVIYRIIYRIMIITHICERTQWRIQDFESGKARPNFFSVYYIFIFMGMGGGVLWMKGCKGMGEKKMV